MKLISKNGHGIFVKNNIAYFVNGNTYYKFDTNNTSKISKTEYLYNKYENTTRFWNKPTDNYAKLKNGNFLISNYEESVIKVFNKKGEIIKKLDDISSPYGMSIYGISIDKFDNLWITVPTEHYIGKFNILKQRELFSICGTKDLEPTIFDHPESVTIIDDYAYISDMGNKRIIKIDIKTHHISTHKKVKEPIFYFNKIREKEIHSLQSGIYLV